MKKVLKVLSLVLVFALVMAPTITLADVPINVGSTTGEADLSGLDGLVGTIIQIITYIGYAIAVVMILWLGVQWILATPSKKAELKGKMWSMAIGIVLLVGGVSVLNFVWNLAEQGKETIG